MIDLDARFGFMRWRVAGLAVNLLANGIALYGAVRLLRDGTHGPVLAAGLALSLACVVLLSRPDLRTRAEGRAEGKAESEAESETEGEAEGPEAP